MLGVSPLCALALVTVGLNLDGIFRHVLFALALLVIAVGVTTAVCLQLPEYTYEISDADCPGQYDLIISSRLGKRLQTNCRVRTAGTLAPYDKKRRIRTKKILCCRLFPGERKYVFLPDEAEGEYALLLCPNEEMVQILRQLGVILQ